MKWLQENPFLAGLGGITLIGAGVLAYLLSGALTQYGEASDAYAQATQKLHSLQNRSPFPNSENLEKTRAVTAAYQAEFSKFQSKLAAMEAPINASVKPQQFQDDLRAAVNETIDKAAQAGVTLPKDFYLSFGQYANNLPSEQAAPALARQLVLIKDLVQRLIAFKVQSIDLLERSPLPQEKAATAIVNKPSTATPKGNQAAPANKMETVMLERFPFDLVFTAEQSKFRVAFNSLLANDRYLIVRALNIQNSSIAGPPIANPNAPAQPATAPAPGAAAPGSQSLNVLLGRESVRVAARIEMIDFAELPEAKK